MSRHRCSGRAEPRRLTGRRDAACCTNESAPPPHSPSTPCKSDDHCSPPGSCDAVQNRDNLGESGGILDEFSMMKFSAVTRQRTAVAARPTFVPAGSLMAGGLQAWLSRRGRSGSTELQELGGAAHHISHCFLHRQHEAMPVPLVVRLFVTLGGRSVSILLLEETRLSPDTQRRDRRGGRGTVQRNCVLSPASRHHRQTRIHYPAARRPPRGTQSKSHCYGRGA